MGGLCLIHLCLLGSQFQLLREKATGHDQVDGLPCFWINVRHLRCAQPYQAWNNRKQQRLIGHVGLCRKSNNLSVFVSIEKPKLDWAGQINTLLHSIFLGNQSATALTGETDEQDELVCSYWDRGRNRFEGTTTQLNIGHGSIMENHLDYMKNKNPQTKFLLDLLGEPQSHFLEQKPPVAW